jgi:hypothetical protein
VRSASAADAQLRLVRQASHGGQHLPPIEALAPQIACDAPPDAGQCLGKANHARELQQIARRAPAIVIAILLAPPSIAAGAEKRQIESPADDEEEPVISLMDALKRSVKEKRARRKRRKSV